MVKEIEDGWLTGPEVVWAEEISRQEVYRRAESGELIWKPRPDGRPGRLYSRDSLSFDAKMRLRKEALAEAAKPKVASGGQLELIRQTEAEVQIAALDMTASERGVVSRRHDLVDQCLNHNWKAEGFPSKTKFLRSLAKRNHTSVASIRRWVRAWKKSENLLDLVAERRGPPPGSGKNGYGPPALDLDMRAHVIKCWVFEKLTVRQTYRSLVNYLTGKQNSVGCRVDHFYKIPSYDTVARFIRSLDATHRALREGPDAVKAAAGYIDRTYRGVQSLGCVCFDEWIVDVIAYDPRNVARTGRYWLLTLSDESTRYTLVWSLVEDPNEQDELDLLNRLFREFGLPGSIISDRGRLRGRTFGGKFLNRDRAGMYAKRDGILDRLDIKRHLPREHNPRGNRLERFHRELADWARTVPGWCGSDTKQRRMTEADARVARHKDWIRTRQGEPPLLSRDQVLERLNQFMQEFRQRPSKGTDMNGFSPEAVFRQNTPANGFRRISDEQLALEMAERFEVKIRQGGIVELKDGKRYSHPSLVPIQGQRREVTRLRHDHESIRVLSPGEEAIVASRRARIGVNDPDQLSQEWALQMRLRKIVGETVKPLDYDPCATVSQPPKATDVIDRSEFIAAQEPATLQAPCGSNEISSSEYLMEGDRYKKRITPLYFDDLEQS
jgi:transposase InsO family protein